MTRIVGLELRKMFDTRSGFWMMVSIVVLSLIATASVIAFAPEEAFEYSTFAAAIGIPMGVILPVLAILSVTSEWSQRSGLTTFTMIPRRGRVIAAKAIATILVGIASILVSLVIGALGNVVGTALADQSLVWDVGTTDLAQILLAQVLGMLVGFTLGVLIRSSAAAIVGYFVYGFVLTTVFELLAAAQSWFQELRPWVDFNFASTRLYDTALSAEQWANLGVAGLLWLILPLAAGLFLVMRSEVK